MRTINVNQPVASNFRKKARISGAIMLSAICLMGMTSCEDDDDDPIVNTFNEQDRNFAMTSSEYLNAQISFGQLALTNGEDDSVIKYAEMLVSENTDSRTELEGIVDGEDVEISDGVSDAMQAKYDELATLQGDNFDEAFIDFQIDLLDDSMSMFENEVDNGENFSMKGFAEKTLGFLKDQKQDAVLTKGELELENV